MAYISFKPTDNFSTKLYTGNASTNAITGVGFQPDSVVTKSRNATYDWMQYDSVRGATKEIRWNGNWSEATGANLLQSFDSDGFTLGSTDTSNNSGTTFVSYNWKMGTTSGLSGGSITPLNYSINTTAKMSVIRYTGNSTSGATVPHGLGVKPASMWVKKVTGGADSWAIYNKSMTATSYLELDVANGIASNAGRWNNTEPTTSVFSLGDSSTTNGNNNNYIAYIFAEVPGFSKFASFKGYANNDGPFIYTGFAPAMIIIKSTGSSENWHMYDNKRSTFNVRDKTLDPDQTSAESTLSGIDFLSNGFKMRTSATWGNGSGVNITYYAFAQQPIVGTNDTPGVAQ